jgi:pectate lyase
MQKIDIFSIFPFCYVNILRRTFLYGICILTLSSCGGSDDGNNNSTNGSASAVAIPQGFAVATTGGTSGNIVRVNTTDELIYALCHTTSGGVCIDNEPRIIEVSGTIDFRGSKGSGLKKGCDYGRTCSSPYITEKLVLLDENDAHCDGKTIFDIGYDKATDEPLLIGSNKTVIGVGSNAAIKGKEVRLYKVNNVIVRNLTISDINEGIIFAGDGMLLYDVDNIWIDHNRFERIGRHFITGGFGAVKNTTISWNDFNGNSFYSNNCDGIHYWNVFLVGETQSITLANNWFREFSGRAPKVSGNTMMHMVNNYFQHATGHALDVHSELNSVSKVLVEGNYFEDVNTPITVGSSSIFATIGAPDSTVQALCQNALGRNCVGNFLTRTPSVNKFVQDPNVTDTFHSVLSTSVIVPISAEEVPASIKANAGPGHI